MGIDVHTCNRHTRLQPQIATCGPREPSTASAEMARIDQAGELHFDFLYLPDLLPLPTFIFLGQHSLNALRFTWATLKTNPPI